MWIRREQAKDVTSQKLEVDFHFKDDDNLSVTDEGGQNTRDSGIIERIQNTLDSSLTPIVEENIPIIKIKKKKINKEKFKNLIGEKFEEWFLDSKQINDTYFLKNHFKKNNDVEVLLFEDFNTTGIKGGPKPHNIRMSDGSRNDYYAFIWDVGSKMDKGDDKGGSVGIGRLTFGLSSKINTFFVYTKQKFKDYDNIYFTGLANFGQSETNSFLDPIARFGVEGDEGIPNPISDDRDLETIREIFQLDRKKDEAGSSMIVPFPIDDLTNENIILNFIKRYRVGLYLNQFKVYVEEECISRETIKDVIKKYIPSEYTSYCSFFDFIDNCAKIEKNKSSYKIKFSDQNPSEIRKDDFNEEDITKIIQSIEKNETVGIRIPLNIHERKKTDNSYIDDIKKSFVDVYLQKTDMGLGKQDTLRGIMSVSGLRNFEGKDYHAVVNIQDKPSSKMFRKLETPNHKFFSNHSKEFEKSYGKYRNQLLLVQKAPERLKSLFEEIEGKIDSDAADDFFNFGRGSESGRSKSKRSGSGKDSDFNLPDNLFSNPKAYEIKKVSKDNLSGFKIYNLDFKEQCKKIIEKISLFLEKNKDEEKFTKKEKRNLESQLEKNKSWLKDENLDELFPSKIFITVAQDLEGQDDKSFKYHNNDLDFDLANNIRHKILATKEGDISDIEISGNQIDISVTGPNYSYELLTDALEIKKTNEASDLRVFAYMKTYKKDEKNIKLHR
jgi:hypothetical protein